MGRREDTGHLLSRKGIWQRKKGEEEEREREMKNNLTKIVDQVSGIARCPYNPHHNTTALFTEDGDLYTGTVMDFMARDAVVYRTLGPSPPLRTAQLNSKWLNNPNFVSSYEIGPYVYFFFRETAVEFSNCGQVSLNRVLINHFTFTLTVPPHTNTSQLMGHQKGTDLPVTNFQCVKQQQGTTIGNRYL
nr:semaphorin-5A-like [Lytechinus pictus]